VARVGLKRAAYRVWVGNLKDGNHLEDLSLHRKVILERIFNKSQAKP